MKNININSIEIEGIDIKDYPDYCDAFISYAEYKDGTILNDEQVEKLNEDHSEIVNELIHENQLYL